MREYIKRRQKNINNNGNAPATAGFTLVELIVTLVIMSILLSFSAAGILAYQDFADFKRQNEYARTLFMSAQIQLTQYTQRGQVTGLQAVLDDGSIDPDNAGILDLDILNLIASDGLPISESSIWIDELEDVSRNIYYLMGTPEDYEEYAEHGSGKVGPEINALYQILDPYIYDKGILRNGSVCIEFDPVEGMVYSVFYSDKRENGFTYTDSKTKTNICDRRETSRKKEFIGYYGVDRLAKSTSSRYYGSNINAERICGKQSGGASE